jgi:flavin reductase (DIM6/NTAB) family NADH-FMN oxidoreductase RutF
MKHISAQLLSTMTERYRAHLINSLSGFKSANLIGSINDQEQTNLAMFSSVIHLGASPALVGFITRPNSVCRHTLENIKQRKQYTINQVSEDFFIAAHQTSARYLKQQNEFKETGLTEQYIEGCLAPFVKQSKLKYALELREIIPISHNNTQLVIGEITDVICDEQAIKNDGYIDIGSLNTVSVSGLDCYHASTILSRLSYAKTDCAPTKIDINGKPINNVT